jgi:hypothetical protein
MQMIEKRDRRVGARHYLIWLAPVLWGVFFLSLMVLSHTKQRNAALYAPLVIGPFLVVLIVLFWALDLTNKRGLLTPPGAGVGVVGLAMLYVLLVFLFTPAYIASIRLGDQLVTRNETPITYDSHGQLVYFGFVTVSTLGYGDIVPTIDSRRTHALICVQVVVFWMFFLLAFGTTEHWVREGQTPAKLGPVRANKGESLTYNKE